MRIAGAFDYLNNIFNSMGSGGIDTAEKYTGVSSFISVLARFFVICGVGLSIVALAYGFLQIATSSGDPKNAERARRTIMWGAAGLLISLFAYVLVKVLINTTGITGLHPYPGL
jgi:cytochrome bd-type quinol oxidase subunit 2